MTKDSNVHVDALLERSSLASPGIRLLRRRTPEAVREAIRRRTQVPPHGQRLKAD